MIERFNSEAERDELIAKTAKSIAAQISEAIVTDDGEAQEIAGDLFGCMDARLGARLLRLFLVDTEFSNAIAVGLIRVELTNTISKTAEHRAIKQIEEENE